MASSACDRFSYSTRAYPYDSGSSGVSPSGLLKTHLDVSRPSIQVQMQVLELAVFAKLVLDVLFGSFFVHACHDDYPPFNGCVANRGMCEMTSNTFELPALTLCCYHLLLRCF